MRNLMILPVFYEYYTYPYPRKHSDNDVIIILTNV
jgi:hypothetical protein